MNGFFAAHSGKCLRPPWALRHGTSRDSCSATRNGAGLNNGLIGAGMPAAPRCLVVIWRSGENISADDGPASIHLDGLAQEIEPGLTLESSLNH
jgi:hypothetical protein